MAGSPPKGFGGVGVCGALGRNFVLTGLVLVTLTPAIAIYFLEALLKSFFTSTSGPCGPRSLVLRLVVESSFWFVDARASRRDFYMVIP